MASRQRRDIHRLAVTAGGRLRVPALALLLLGATAGRADAEVIVHRVAEGHTLGAIARRYGTTVEAIEGTNDLKPGQRLRPGQQLRVVLADLPATTAAAVPGRDDPAERAARLRCAKHPATGGAPAREEDPAARAARYRGGAASTSVLGPRTEAPPPATVRDVSTRPPATSRAALFARRPPRPGYVTMIRFSERFQGQLVDAEGRLPAATHAKVSWLLRDLRARRTVPIDPRLMRDLARVSDYFGGRPIVLVSGFRMYSTGQYARDSRHNYGRAIDFRIVGVPNDALRDYCLTLPAVGVGYYPNSTFVHLDTRSVKAAWVDESRPGRPPSYVRPAAHPWRTALGPTEIPPRGTREARRQAAP